MMGIAASPWQVQCTLAVRSASGCTQVAQRGAIVPDDTLEVLGALCARVDARQHVHLHTATWALSSGCRCRLRGCPALDIAGRYEDHKQFYRLTREVRSFCCWRVGCCGHCAAKVCRNVQVPRPSSSLEMPPPAMLMHMHMR